MLMNISHNVATPLRCGDESLCKIKLSSGSMKLQNNADKHCL